MRTSVGRSTWWYRGISAAFYIVLVLLLCLILTNTLRDVLPDKPARRIGANSEAYLFAVVVSAWLQLAHARLYGARRWQAAFAVSAACVATALALLSSDLPSRITTLNEGLFALAVVIPYLALRRPLSRLVLLVPLLVLGGIVLSLHLDPDGFWIDLAETFGYWMLVPLAFDAVDRGILDETATTSRPLRYAFYAFCVAVPVVVSALGTGERVGGGVHALLSYLGRIHESFIGVLLVVLLFAVVLGRTGRDAGGTSTGRHARPIAVA